MKQISRFFILLSVPALSLESQSPNILFIMSDDHAEAAISAYGSEISQLAPTPNIDRIASEGAIFQSNYCCNSISGPSRAAVLTGKHSHLNGFSQNNREGFDGSQTTLPKLLQKAGYNTAVIGKWHLNTLPTGFNYYDILIDQGEYYNPYFISAGDTLREMGYTTDIITRKSLDWIKNATPDRPFFLMMHHKAPHRNWVPAPRYYNLYDSVVFPIPSNYFDDYKGRIAAAKQEMNIYRDMYEGHDLKMTKGIDNDSLLFDPWPHAFLETMTEAERHIYHQAYRNKNNEFYKVQRTEKEKAEWKLQRYLQEYLSTIKSVDESVGELLTFLEQNGLDKNTIVVYTSDQGFYLGEHGWFDKRFMYEESMKMPLLMRYPPFIQAGTKVSNLTQNIDFAPTFLDFCGLTAPSEMQGVSFKTLLNDSNGKQKEWREYLYYHYYEYPGFHSVFAHFGIKGQRYKLIYFYEQDLWELFDIVEDPSEMNNIYGRKGMEKIEKQLKNSLDSLQEVYQLPEKFRQWRN